jgi:hypothetical protein
VQKQLDGIVRGIEEMTRELGGGILSGGAWMEQSFYRQQSFPLSQALPVVYFTLDYWSVYDIYRKAISTEYLQ